MKLSDSCLCIKMVSLLLKHVPSTDAEPLFCIQPVRVRPHLCLAVPIFVRPDHPHRPVCLAGPTGPTGPYRPLSYSLHELSYICSLSITQCPSDGPTHFRHFGSTSDPTGSSVYFSFSLTDSRMLLFSLTDSRMLLLSFFTWYSQLSLITLRPLTSVPDFGPA